MEMTEILEEAKLAAEMVAEELSDIYLPLDEIKLCKSGVLPEHHWLLKGQLNSAANSLNRLIIKIDKWKDTLDRVEHGELFFKRHMLALIEALRDLRTEVNEARQFIREKTRQPLIKPAVKWYLEREKE